ncbi:SDR family oxidoreductase [Hymenobacter sp. H14-R3]|uniref:SDR family oxidoreductase n=1 Tax=Hymenobacter sp. H14-R3 TaxID=3046308 RepID=UPI0024BB4C39|nr:SDR family oxidoreductase [Hymenobacter sp. H14-R3]MDJ0364923.1 SDR family oxidoreductase [Hymenobacter sp. H14-R3]
MDLGITGKVALVTAASKGLGRAVAEELAAEGASLVLCARTDATLQATCTAIRAATGARVLGVAADVANPADVARLVQAALAEFGQVDILVTNAGGPPAGTFEQHDAAAWDAATRLLLSSVVELTRAVLPGMQARGWGRILNITSIAVKQPVAGLMLSNSLRAAVTGMARTLATEVAASGVTVNNILPGYTRTERVEHLASAAATRDNISPEQATERWTSEIPMRRLGEPREFAALAAFLCSERASYITGTSTAVDGGWLRGLY